MRRLLLLAALAGTATAAAVGGSASASGVNCSDFSNQAAAQSYFLAHGGPSSDPEGLDADHDGIACESLKCPCSYSTTPTTTTPTPTTTTPTTTTPTTTTPTTTLPPPPPPRAPATRTSVRIASVVDGDTIKVRKRNGRRVTVRLIGIDTPETKKPGVAVECGGVIASQSMHDLAFQSRRGRLVGRVATLISDPSQDAKDRYGRTLAYVEAYGRGDLGKRMVRSGWAAVYVYRVPFARLASYTAASDAAKTASAGVWGACSGDFHSAQ